MSGDGPLSGTAKSYQARVRARLRRMGESPWASVSRNPNVLAASSMPCSPAIASTVLSWSRRCCSGCASKSQLSPKL